MNGDPIQDEDVIALLENLKTTGAPYPAPMFEQQKQAFKKGAALLGASMIVWSLFGLKGTLKIGFIENLLKWALIGALAVQVAVGGYVFRKEIRQLFLPPTPSVILEPLVKPFATAARAVPIPGSNTPEPEETVTPLPSPTARASLTPAATFNTDTLVEPSFTPTATRGNRLGLTSTPPGKRDTSTPDPTKTPKP